MPAPAPNLIADLLNALLAALNAALPTLGAERVNNGQTWYESVPDAGRVVIVTKDQTTVPVLVSCNQKKIRVDIGFARKLTSDSNELVDAALAWVQTVEALWDEDGELRDTDLAGCSWLGITRKPLYSVKKLTEHHLFTTALTLEFSSDV